MSYRKWLPPWRARKQQQAEAERIKRESERDHAVLTAINALVDEFRAEHKRQATENAKKNSREKWTIRGLLATAVAALAALLVSIYQVRLTQRSISDAEKTSVAQANDTKSSLNIAQQAAAATSSQAALAQETLIASSRAWIGIEQASSPAPVVNKELTVKVQYANTGREPATEVQVHGQYFSFPVQDQKTAIGSIVKFDNQCTGLKQDTVGVVYPTTGFSSYSYLPRIPAKTIDGAVVNGTSMLVEAGCFTYDTFQAVHYSYFCVAYEAKSSTPDSWLFCQVGNHAE